MSLGKVFVGLSGGVDSAVAALLLQRTGYEVVGVFMKNWTADVAGNHCPWREDLHSARAVAAHLKIPLEVYDFQVEYKAKVADYMVVTYRRGLTPNPDIMCNQEIKFGVFYDRCRAHGADFVATGHYARMIDGQLYRGRDDSKDQSYFLYRIPSNATGQVLFPLGEYHKKQIRQIAQEVGLPNAKRADSQGICFVGNVNLKDFLHEYIDFVPGDIVDDHGKTIGRHDGVFFYTIGQRHGLGVGGGKPYFVYDKDVTKNIIYVTTDPVSPLLSQDTIVVGDTHWWQMPASSKEYGIQVRYRSQPVPGRVDQTEAGCVIKLDKPERAIAPGQAVVVYDGDRCLGGGVIQ